MSVTRFRIKIQIYERVCVITLRYYLYWFEISYPTVTLNRVDGPFFIQGMKVIQGTEPSGRQCNRLLDAVVGIITYKKSIIYHDIYVKVLSDETVFYHTLSTDDVLNTTNNETDFTELTRVFEERFNIKVEEGSVLKYLNFQI